jgi:hypothetical protein
VTNPVKLSTSAFTVEAAIDGLNPNMSDGRYTIDGTWSDKMRIHEDTYVIGEIHAGSEARDLEKVPKGVRCYLTNPMQGVLRWASAEKIQETLGGTRHDYVNRGDAVKANKEDGYSPRRGYMIINADGTVTVTTS